MTPTARMIRAHPDHSEADEKAFSRAIDELLACAQACTTCADACLAEDHVVDLVTCIRLNLGCADLCTAAARFFSRRFDLGAADSLLEACIVGLPDLRRRVRRSRQQSRTLSGVRRGVPPVRCGVLPVADSSGRGGQRRRMSHTDSE